MQGLGLPRAAASGTRGGHSQRTALRSALRARRQEGQRILFLARNQFQGLVREIQEERGWWYRVQPAALTALQTAAEQALAALLGEAQLLAAHAKRVTTCARDLRTAVRLRQLYGDPSLQGQTQSASSCGLRPPVWRVGLRGVRRSGLVREVSAGKR